MFLRKIKHKTVILNNLNELDTISSDVELFGKNAILGTKIIHTINIILDELLSNIIFYSFTDKESHEIKVSFEKWRKTISMVIEYGGLEFDPRNAPEPDLESSAVDRKIGGLGIHIVLKMADTFHYQRKNGMNTIVIKLKIKD